ncbi:MAG: HPF/RaiA family ribosome-associated protein [Bacteroidota bacterium]|nr:HPF/RaiA family ribosome-associated protein [Bacteroidota bacterium]
MKINLQSLHFKASDNIKEFVEDKVGKLSHFDDKILSADVTLFSDDGKSIDNKVCEIRLVVPGYDDFVKRNAGSFEEAIADAVETLQKILRRKKDKV